MVGDENYDTVYAHNMGIIDAAFRGRMWLIIGGWATSMTMILIFAVVAS